MKEITTIIPVTLKKLLKDTPILTYVNYDGTLCEVCIVDLSLSSTTICWTLDFARRTISKQHMYRCSVESEIRYLLDSKSADNFHIFEITADEAKKHLIMELI